MKMLKKLALVSAISMISAGAFAMEAMDDESMSAATGQDGITILVKPGFISDATAANMGVSQASRDLLDNPTAGYYANNDNAFAGLSIGSIVVHDDDGMGPVTGDGLGNSGALVIGGGYDKNGNGVTTGAGDVGDVSAFADRTVLLADGSKGITIDVDMVGNVTAAAAAAASTASTALTTANTAVTAANGAVTTANNNLTAARDARAVADTLGTITTYAALSPTQKVTADAHSSVVTALGASESATATAAAAVVTAANASSASATAAALAATSPGAMLNVKISTPRLAIKTGNIYVANSNAAEAERLADGTGSAGALEVDGTDTTPGSKIKILSGLEVVLGEASTTIQLGSEAQGHMIVANTTLIGGLTINNLELFDAGGVLNPTLGTVVTTGGSFYAKSLSLKDAGGTSLTVKANIDIGSANSSVYAGVPLTTVQSNVDLALTAPVFSNALASGSAPTTNFGGPALIGTYASYTQLATLAAGGDANAATDKAVVDGISANAPALAGYRAAGVASLQAGAQAAYNGLVIETAQLGHATNGADLAINNIRIGDSSAKTLGDVQILGLNINGTVMVISGH